MARTLPSKLADSTVWQRALRDVHDEVVSQEKEFAECLELAPSAWAAALTEELGKTSGAVLRRDLDGVRDGVLRLAGCALRFLCWLDARAENAAQKAKG